MQFILLGFLLGCYQFPEVGKHLTAWPCCLLLVYSLEVKERLRWVVRATRRGGSQSLVLCMREDTLFDAHIWPTSFCLGSIWILDPVHQCQSCIYVIILSHNYFCDSLLRKNNFPPSSITCSVALSIWCLL